MPTPLRIAVGATIESGGLSLDLIDAFHTYVQGAYTLSWTSIGSGGGMNMARAGQVDIVLTHDIIGDSIFIRQGYAQVRCPVFWNRFVLAGPINSTIQGTLQASFNTVATQNLPFVSRGAAALSGTYVREMQIWSKIGSRTTNLPNVTPGNPNLGVNPRETLEFANSYNNNAGAYVLIDTGSWYNFVYTKGLTKEPVNLKVLTNIEDPWGTNQYALMPVNPAKFSDGVINTQGAIAFLEWMLSVNGKNTVNNNVPDGVHQAFYYNAEVFPTDNIIQPITGHPSV